MLVMIPVSVLLFQKNEYNRVGICAYGAIAIASLIRNTLPLGGEAHKTGHCKNIHTCDTFK